MWSTLAVLLAVKPGWRSFDIYIQEGERKHFQLRMREKFLCTSYHHWRIRPFTNVWERTSSALYLNQPQQQVISYSEDMKYLAPTDRQILWSPYSKSLEILVLLNFLRNFSGDSWDTQSVHRNTRELRRGRSGNVNVMCVHQTVVNFYLYWRRAC